MNTFPEGGGSPGSTALRRLRRDLLLLCAGITGAILVLISSVSLGVSERQLTQRGQAMFQSSVNDLAFRLSTERVLSWTWLAQLEAENNVVIHIEDNGSPFLFSGNWQPDTPREILVEQAKRIALEQYNIDVNVRPRSALQSPQAQFTLTGDLGENYRVAVIVIRTEAGFMSLTALGDIYRAEGAGLQQQRLTFLWIGLGALALLLAFSWWFSGRAIRPVAEGHKRQAEFIAAASHELRTPLAVIRTSAAALEVDLSLGQNNRFMQAVDRECRRTSKLVDDLLILANADADNWNLAPGPVELEQVIQGSVDSFAALAAEKGQHIRVQAAPGLPVIAGDEHRLTQLVGILLDNACRHTPRDGVIGVRVRRQGRALCLSVADNGPGIPREHREKVFDRFYRADASRTEKEHYGLGLSIALEIVQLHRGKISLCDTPGGGLTVSVELPLLPRG